MVMKIGRKGDVTITTVILIVLGLAVLVMMIIGFTKGWDFFFGIFDNAPSELQTFAKACILYAQGSLSIDFCSYKLIGNELVNCMDTRIESTLKDAGVKPLSCDTLSATQFNACKNLANGKPETRINGNAKCSQFYTKCTGTFVDDKGSNDCSTLTVEVCKTKKGCTLEMPPSA